MKKKSLDNIISEEILAAYLDANANADETRLVIDSLCDDEELRELMQISQLVDSDLSMSHEEVEILPMTALAANCAESNLCCLECERYILNRRGVIYEDEMLLRVAIENEWKKENGTPLYNIGRNLEQYGLSVSRHYDCDMRYLIYALKRGDDVIAAVDGGELIGNAAKEYVEDVVYGHRPDHCVVVLDYNEDERQITIYDPDSENRQDVYPIDKFADAWADSNFYLVTINTKDMKEYNPKPIDLSDVELTDDLTELREAIAENAHDIWALARKKEGWTYGEKRDDDKKQNPCMVPYCDLPESEKDYDREMAMQTIKLIKKLGYDLIKREDTELYRMLLRRIRNASFDLKCPECQRNGNITPIAIHDVFCSKCGHKLDIDWNVFLNEKTLS